MLKYGIVALFALFSAGALANSPKTDFAPICTQLLQIKPEFPKFSTYFTKDFQDKATLEEIESIFLDLYRDVGKCTSYDSKLKDKGTYQVTLTSQKGLKVSLIVRTEESSGLVTGMQLDGVSDPDVQIRGWDDVQSALHRLAPHGKASATLITQDRSVRLTHNASEVFAIGSAFKLYILGALSLSIEKGTHKWDEVLPLREDWKSLPSGVMQDWPAGKEVKLQEYAEDMISISDNTAADHLLYFLGRDNVEAMLSMMGNSHEASYLPFLSTLEAFKLKWAFTPDQTNAYIALNRTQRLQVLDWMRITSKSTIGTNGVRYDQPVHIDKLEWFATTAENCDAMFWLAARKGPQIKKILSKNVPLLDDVGKDGGHWTYAGYKGGSEPGVLNMTFLLQSKSGALGCFAMSANDKTESISQYQFMDIAKKALKYAEQKF